jgi:nitrogen fixation protein NifQ
MFLPLAQTNATVPAPCIAIEPDDMREADPLASAEAVYQRLVDGSAPDAADSFDIHVTACIFALAFREAVAEQRPLSATTGLDPAELTPVIDDFFPHAAGMFLPEKDAPLIRNADEACLLDLLDHCATDGSTFQARLAAMIARRAQSPNHLWQDLGLRNRGELSRLMARHFRPLATRNTNDMKWKKFLYRMICRDAGYSICTAPSCSECSDFEHCFGDESGESRLARVRRTSDAAGNAMTVETRG